MFNWWKLSFCVAPYLIFAIEWVLMRAALRGHAGRVTLPLTAFGLIAASKFVGFQIFGGNAFNPELPVWLLFAWGWMESVVWIGLPVGFCAALFGWIARRFLRAAEGGRSTWQGGRGIMQGGRDFEYGGRLGRLMWMSIGVSMALAAYGMWEGMRLPRVVEREIEFADLPPAFDGYRIAHVSDLHCSSAARREKIAGIVERVNAAKPDLVCITGDFVDGFPEQRLEDLEPLAQLEAPDCVLGCTGNHEKYWRIARWAPHFEAWGVKMLRNEWTAIEREDARHGVPRPRKNRLVIGGMDDLALGAHTAKVYEGAPEGFRILLFHRPYGLEAHDRIYQVRLQLSGHTHGGAMPIIDKFVARANEGHVRGLYREGNIVLHNSPGSGQWAGFPLRLFNPPEITILILKKSRGVLPRMDDIRTLLPPGGRI